MCVWALCVCVWLCKCCSSALHALKTLACISVMSSCLAATIQMLFILRFASRHASEYWISMKYRCRVWKHLYFYRQLPFFVIFFFFWCRKSDDMNAVAWLNYNGKEMRKRESGWWLGCFHHFHISRAHSKWLTMTKERLKWISSINPLGMTTSMWTWCISRRLGYIFQPMSKRKKNSFQEASRTPRSTFM